MSLGTAGAVGAQLFVQLLVATPLVIVYLVGLALGARLWSRRHAAAVLLVSGCALALVTDLVGLTITSLTPFMISSRGLRPSQIGIVFGAVGLLRGLLTALAWGLLIAAVWRAARGEEARGDGGDARRAT